MVVVGIFDNKLFESQSYKTEEEKEIITQNIILDAQSSNLTVEIQYMTDAELSSLL